MILRHWVPVAIASGILLAGITGMLWRIEDRIAVRQDNLDRQLKRVRQELLVDTQTLDLELRQQSNDCLAQPKKGE